MLAESKPGGPPPTAPLIERSAELAAIADAIEQAAAGNGRVVLVRGPAGIGKTALLRAARERARRHGGLTVLTHNGTPLEQRHSYGAVVGLLGPAVFEFLEAGGREVLRGASEHALPLFEGGTISRNGEFPVLHGLHWLCATLAEQRPLVLLADDIAWYDEPSRRALAYLAERVADLPICLVLAQRTGGDEAEDLIALGQRADTVLEPAPLSAPAVEALTAQFTAAGDATSLDTDNGLVSELGRRSGGNPFLLLQLLRHLADDGSPPPDGTAPEAVVAMMEHTLGRLPEDARAVAEACAVLGDGARINEAAGVLDANLGAVTVWIDELVGRDILAPAERLRFRHPLLRDAVLTGMAPARRLSRTLAAAAHRYPEDPVRAAGHLLDAAELAPVGDPWVLQTLETAAADALARGGLSEAARYLERALAESLSPAEECRIRHQLGGVLDENQDPRALEELARAEELARDSETTAEVALARSTALFHFAMLPEAARVARAAQAALGEDGSDELRLSLEAAALNAEGMVGINRSRPAALRAEVAAGATPAQRALLANVAWDLASRGDEPSARTRAASLTAIAGGKLTEEVGAASPHYVFAGTALAWAGDYPAAREHAETGIAHATRAGSLVGLAYATSLRAGVAVLQGDIKQAEIDVRRVLDELADVDPLCFAITLGWATEVAIEREQAETAWSLFELSGLAGEVPELGPLDLMLLSRARLRAEIGDRDGALADLDIVTRRGEEAIYLNPACNHSRSMTALLLREAGETERPRTLVETELALARAYQAPRPIGVALRARAALATDPADAIADLREAAAVLATSGAELERAEAEIDLGSLEAAGDIEDRRATLQAGMDRAHRCGSTRAVSRALTALRATGARPRRPSSRGVDALTPQESRVVQLASTGLTNREIAEAMFLTRRTVELHLTNSYRKLGVTRREDLAAATAAAS